MLQSNQLSDRIPKTITRPEVELFLYCSRLEINQQIRERVKILLRGAFDWDYLIHNTICFGTPTLLYWNLISLFSEEIPQVIEAKLRDLYLINSIKNSVLKDELLVLLSLLESHHIPVIPFKGPVLSLSAYGDLGKRIFSDLDILVHEQDFKRAKDIILEKGYKPKFDQSYEVKNLQAQLERNDGNVSVDLHYAIPPKGLHLDSDIFWSSVESFSLSGQRIQVLTPEAHLLILCVNGNKEAWQFFGKVCDIAAMLHSHREIDWDWIETQSQALGIRRIVHFGLFLSHVFLGSDIPENIRKGCESNLIMRWLVLALSQRIFPTSMAFQRFRLGAYDFVYLFYINQALIPVFFNMIVSPSKADKDYFFLPKNMSFLYYIVRPFRLLFQYGSKVFRFYEVG